MHIFKFRNSIPLISDEMQVSNVPYLFIAAVILRITAIIRSDGDISGKNARIKVKCAAHQSADCSAVDSFRAKKAAIWLSGSDQSAVCPVLYDKVS